MYAQATTLMNHNLTRFSVSYTYWENLSWTMLVFGCHMEPANLCCHNWPWSTKGFPISVMGLENATIKLGSEIRKNIPHGSQLQ
jgi:hypothetical protein